MSAGPERNPKLTVECFICGRENPIGRQYCQFCKQRILASPPDELAIKDDRSEPKEPHPLQVSLQGAQEENQKLRQQVESMQQQLDNIRAAHVEHSPGLVADLQNGWKAAEEKAVAWASHAASWETKWKSAEAKAVEFEQKLVAKAQEVEKFVAATPGAQSTGRLKVISGIIAVLGSLAGYGTGRYVQPKEDTSGLTAQVDSAKKEAGSLKTLLHDATIKVDTVQTQAKADFDAASRKIRDLTAHQEQLQRQLDEATTENTRVSETIKQRDTQVAALSAQLASSGELVWKGTVDGKTTISGSSLTSGIVSGALPRRPCKVSTQDPRVKIRNRPSAKNHWSDLSFEVSGSGPVQVKIDWEITQ